MLWLVWVSFSATALAGEGFTLVLTAGEAWRDASAYKHAFVLAGSRLTRTAAAEGMTRLLSSDLQPVFVTLASNTVIDEAVAALMARPEEPAVAEALAAVLASPDDRGPEPTLTSARDHRGCLVSAGLQRCAVAMGKDSTVRLKALEALGAALETRFSAPDRRFPLDRGHDE